VIRNDSWLVRGLALNDDVMGSRRTKTDESICFDCFVCLCAGEVRLHTTHKS